MQVILIICMWKPEHQHKHVHNLILNPSNFPCVKFDVMLELKVPTLNTVQKKFQRHI